MKKIISLMTVVAMIVSMSSLTAFATNTRTVTLSTDVTTANVGDEIEALATLDTSNTVKTIGVKIAFDPNDLELGVSAESKAVAEEYADYIGTEDFPTIDDVTKTILGRASYVSDNYANTYAGYASTKNLGAATIDYQEKDGLGKVTFGYAISTAKNALNKIDNMIIGGVVLKVKTTAKKQTTIKLVEAANSDKDDTAYNTIVNEVVINLNGYVPGSDPVDPITVTEADNGATVLEYADDYDGEKKLEGKYIVMRDAIAAAGTLTEASRVVVEYKDGDSPLNKVVEYGKSIFEFLGITGEGEVKNPKGIKFGIVYEDANYKAANFTFTIK